LLHHNNFISAINYTNPEEDDYYVSDVRTGINYKNHMNEMKAKYDEFIASQENESEFIMVNLCISQFYDGTQIRTTKMQTFWPLFITILNLPPPMRMSLGVGLFLLSIFTAGQFTPAEKFILEDCFAKELEQFSTGVSIEVNGLSYFVQIRLISTILDTIGFQDVFKVVGANSYEGCFFCKGIGKGTNLMKGMSETSTNARRSYIQVFLIPID
jgi:hypothetical protein